MFFYRRSCRDERESGQDEDFKNHDGCMFNTKQF